MILRLKFPLMCQPEPELVLFKNSQPVPDGDDHCLAVLRDSNVLLKIDSAQVRKINIQFKIKIKVS